MGEQPFARRTPTGYRVGRLADSPPLQHLQPRDAKIKNYEVLLFEGSEVKDCLRTDICQLSDWSPQSAVLPLSDLFIKFIIPNLPGIDRRSNVGGYLFKVS